MRSQAGHSNGMGAPEVNERCRQLRNKEDLHVERRDAIPHTQGKAGYHHDVVEQRERVAQRLLCAHQVVKVAQQ